MTLADGWPEGRGGIIGGPSSREDALCTFSVTADAVGMIGERTGSGGWLLSEEGAGCSFTESEEAALTSSFSSDSRTAAEEGTVSLYIITE